MGPTRHSITGGRIHVETFIRAPLDDVWRYTQAPALHQRWDVRFSTIEYLPRAAGEDVQRFAYVRRILPGLSIHGTGATVGERRRPDGTATSALLFESSHPLSLIRRGSGFWQYVPEPNGVRFLTGYDYEPRWGRFGRQVDRWLFRPALAWATGVSFDRLRVWLETGRTPEQECRAMLGRVAMRTVALGAGAAVLRRAIRGSVG